MRQMLLVIKFLRFVDLKRTQVALKRTILLQVSSAKLLVILTFAFLSQNCRQLRLPGLLLLLPLPPKLLHLL